MVLVWSVLVVLVANIFVLAQRWTEVLVTLLLGVVGLAVYGLVRLWGTPGGDGQEPVEAGEGREGKAEGTARDGASEVRWPGRTVVTASTPVWGGGRGVDWPVVLFVAESLTVVGLAVLMVLR